MARRAQRLRPYTIGEFRAGHDCYAHTVSLDGAGRWWTYRNNLVCVQRRTGEYLRTPAGFDGIANDDALRTVVEECRQTFGVSFPSGWVAPFRAQYRAKRLTWSYNAPFASAFHGGWQQALRRGDIPGPLYKYDLRSAYLWALTPGLPDPRTFRRTRCLASTPALFRVRLARPEPSAPFPYNTFTDVNATGEEIGAYGLDVADVLAGVAWRRDCRDADVDRIYQQVTAPSFWKRTARSYWGLWAQTRDVGCHVASGKSWALPPVTANYVWAHMIVSRVRRRVADAVTSRAAHVFVDSIITPDVLPVGPNVGEWRVDATYAGGLHVRGTGWYAEPGRPWEKAAGVPLADPRRCRDNDSAARSQFRDAGP